MSSEKPQTPLSRYKGPVPNGHEIYIKAEWVKGSHYHRVFPALIKDYERMGRLRPGKIVFETSTGAAGRNCAQAAKDAGYECVIAVPESLPEARWRSIRELGARIVFAPGDYVNGFAEFVAQYRKEHREACYLNHSRGFGGGENKVVSSGMGEIGAELYEQLGIFDTFVLAAGNGSSVLGPVRELQWLRARPHVVSVESFQSAVVFDRLYAGEYFKRFGIAPGSLRQHKLWGTSYQGIECPHLGIALQEGLIDEAVLVSDKDVDANYTEVTREKIPVNIVRWDRVVFPGHGRTTRAGLAVALDIADRRRDRQLKIVLIGYETDQYE